MRPLACMDARREDRARACHAREDGLLPVVEAGDNRLPRGLLRARPLPGRGKARGQKAGSRARHTSRQPRPHQTTPAESIELAADWGLRLVTGS